MKKPIDCSLISGDKKVVISKSTAEYALKAMEEKNERGDYSRLFADDKSFVSYGIGELRKASKC